MLKRRDTEIGSKETSPTIRPSDKSVPGINTNAQNTESWSSEVRSVHLENGLVTEKRVGGWVIVRVTRGDGIYHEAIGHMYLLIEDTKREANTSQDMFTEAVRTARTNAVLAFKQVLEEACYGKENTPSTEKMGKSKEEEPVKRHHDSSQSHPSLASVEEGLAVEEPIAKAPMVISMSLVKAPGRDSKDASQSQEEFELSGDLNTFFQGTDTAQFISRATQERRCDMPTDTSTSNAAFGAQILTELKAEEAGRPNKRSASDQSPGRDGGERDRGKPKRVKRA